MSTNHAFTGDNDGVEGLQTKDDIEICHDVPQAYQMHLPSDRRKRIDFVMAFDETKYGKDEKAKNMQYRNQFHDNLKLIGLELYETLPEESTNGTTCFVLVHAPIHVLERYAEMLNYKMPIDWVDSDFNKQSILDKMRENMCCNAFEYDKDEIPDDVDYFSAPFRASHRNRFMLIKNGEDGYFIDSVRNRLVYYILQQTSFHSTKDVTKSGIHKLVNKGVYTAAYPLHDGPCRKARTENCVAYEESKVFNKPRRQKLFEQWASWRKWFKVQPVDYIKEYFGVKLAIYYSWLGFYTGMLLLPSLLGIIVVIYGSITVSGNNPSQDVCDSEKLGETLLCPRCRENCPFVELKQSCNYAIITYVFDNFGTIVYAAFMSMWAITFLEFWRRRQYALQYDWDVADFQEDEIVRPEYEAQVKRVRRNPITQEEEPYMSLWDKCWRFTLSFSTIAFLVLLVIALVVGVILYRVAMLSVFYLVLPSSIKRYSSFITTTTAACINFCFITIMSVIYKQIALWLSRIEQPRTETEFDNSFTVKMYSFQFVNYYSSIFYIAFLKGQFSFYASVPYEVDGHNVVHNPMTVSESCDASGCMQELVIQVAIIMIGKQLLNNFMELAMPVIKTWLKRRINSSGGDIDLISYSRWEMDYDLIEVPRTGLFDEYLELVIQFGFVTIFAVAFPLAPFFALLNNIIEVRLDAFKHTTQWRRPVAYRAQDIGIWYGILRSIVRIAVLVNAFLIALTSDTVTKIFYSNEYKGGGRDDLNGFTNFTLSVFRIRDLFENREDVQAMRDDASLWPNGSRYDAAERNSTAFCRYRDFRNGPFDQEGRYEHGLDYYQIIVAKLSFVIAFVGLVYFLAWMLEIIIPDKPQYIRILELRENHLLKKALLDEIRRVETVNSGSGQSGNRTENVLSENVEEAEVASTSAAAEVERF